LTEAGVARKKRKVFILIGTRKGAFILAGDEARRDWALKGPSCEAWPISHVIADPKTGAILAGGGNEWFGPAVWRSDDLGETWTHSSEGLSYTEGETPVKSVWSLARGPGGLYAGVEPAGLFGSDDDGATWTPRNKGTRLDVMPEGQRHPEFGQCVHSLVRAPGAPARLYQQNHFGMFRSDDAGLNWDSIEAGLPSTFGFPAPAHPRDRDTLYLLPLNGDLLGRFVPEGKCAVWRTKDAGATWQDLRAGLPQDRAYLTVLRQAMAADALDPAGIYFGASAGAVYASADEGESWVCIARDLPSITSIETFVVEG
jgi:hypothetical protein